MVRFLHQACSISGVVPLSSSSALHLILPFRFRRSPLLIHVRTSSRRGSAHRFVIVRRPAFTRSVVTPRSPPRQAVIASSADSRPPGSSCATYLVKCETRWPISPSPITSLRSSPIVVVLLCHDTRVGASSVPCVRAGEISFRLYHFINRHLC